MNTQQIIQKHVETFTKECNPTKNILPYFTNLIQEIIYRDNREITENQTIEHLHKIWRRDVIHLRTPLEDFIPILFQAGSRGENTISLNGISLNTKELSLTNSITNENLFLSNWDKQMIKSKL